MLYNGKTKAGPACLFGMAFIYTEKAFENAALVFHRYTNTSIFYTDTRMSFFFTYRNPEFSTLPVIFDSIFNQVIKQIVHKLSGCQINNRFAFYFHGNFFAFCHRFQTSAYIFCKSKQIHIFLFIVYFFIIKLAYFDDIVYQSQKTCCFFVDFGRKYRNIFRRYHAVFHQFCKTGNGGKRCF